LFLKGLIMSSLTDKLRQLRAQQAEVSPDFPGLTNGGWDVRATQVMLNAYLGAMPPDFRHTRIVAPEQLTLDGEISNGRGGGGDDDFQRSQPFRQKCPR
jgi:hypothetical protein